MWSGVETVTASIWLPILSRSTLKSLKRRSGPISGWSAKVAAALASSTSQKATRFSLISPETALAPLPPTPMHAMLSLLLGETPPWALMT